MRSIVNSKFQETVSPKAFHVVMVRILPIPPKMLRLSLMSNISIWLGIKSFWFGFRGSRFPVQERFTVLEWAAEWNYHADISPDKETADKGNCARYENPAREIATLRKSTDWIPSTAWISFLLQSRRSYIMSWCRPSKGHKPLIHGRDDFIFVDLDHLRF